MLLVLACLTVGGTLFQTYRFDQRVSVERAREDATTQQLGATDLALADVRQAQSAYVAAGQSPPVWMNYFDEALSRVEGMLRERQRTTLSDGALAHYDAAIEQVEALRVSDARARNYVRSEQLILASDVIFVESLGIIGRISGNVAAARDSEVFSARQSLALLTQYRQGLVGGGLLFTLLFGALAFRKTGVSVTADTPAELSTSMDVAPETTPSPIQNSPDLTDTADVCVDIARLLDSRDLPALLSRAAAAIGAKGLVLWVVDESGQTLRASVAHGYSERMLQRLGHLTVSADNVTSAACRTLQPQWVPGTSAEVLGALAVPLISVAGCVGVLSAEVDGGQAHGQHLHLARLVAAQLSAVIRPGVASVTSETAREV